MSTIADITIFRLKEKENIQAVVPSLLDSGVAVNRITATFFNKDHGNIQVNFEAILKTPYVPQIASYFEFSLLKYQWYHKVPANMLPDPKPHSAYWLRYMKNDDLIFNEILNFKYQDEEGVYFEKLDAFNAHKEIKIPHKAFYIRYSQPNADGSFYSHLLIPV